MDTDGEGTTVTRQLFLMVISLVNSQVVDECRGWAHAGQCAILRKMMVKVTSRAALVYLAPKIPAWRYQRGHRSLSVNLGARVYDYHAHILILSLAELPGYRSSCLSLVLGC
jgi:hypothetical protein